MLEETFAQLLKIAVVYAALGVVVAAVFLFRWIRDIDPAAAMGNIGFRIVVLPGIVALWPLVLMKIFAKSAESAATGAEALRRNHRIGTVFLAIAGLLLFAAALAFREPALADLPTVETPPAP